MILGGRIAIHQAVKPVAVGMELVVRLLELNVQKANQAGGQADTKANNGDAIGESEFLKLPCDGSNVISQHGSRVILNRTGLGIGRLQRSRATFAASPILRYVMAWVDFTHGRHGSTVQKTESIHVFQTSSIGRCRVIETQRVS